MDETPPRRTRRSVPPQRSSLPLVPILIGVVVLGFIIGAGLSYVGKRGPSDRTVVANVASANPAPTPEATLAPVTPAPTDAPATEPPPTATPHVTPHASVAATVPASPKPPRAVATAAVDAAPTANVPTTPPPSAHPTKATTSAATASPATAVPAAPVATARPTIKPTPKATIKAAARTNVRPSVASVPIARVSATPLDAPTPSDDADSEFAKLASAVVRHYVAAIQRGDDATAYAAFGPGAPGNVQLIESGVLDASTRIQHVEARGAGNNVTVNVDLKTAKGLYFGQYTVHRTDSGAALITDHALNKL